MTDPALWQAVVFAALIVLLTAVFYVLAQINADNNELRRCKLHDLRNELVLIRGTLDMLVATMDDPPKRLIDLQDSVATVCALLRHEEETRTRIRLRRYVRAMIMRMIYVHGQVIEFSDRADPRVQVTPVDLQRLLLNLLLNAIQARLASGCDEPVHVTLTDSEITIANPASESDRRTVLRRGASTKGLGHGYGRSSVTRSADRLSWSVQYAVEGNTVTVTLRWNGDRCYDSDDEDGEVDHEQGQELGLN